MPYQRNTVSNRQLAEKHEVLVLVHQAEGECELEPGEGEVGSLSGRQKSASPHLVPDGSYRLEAEKRQQKLLLQRSQVLFHKYITGSKIQELSRN